VIYNTLETFLHQGEPVYNLEQGLIIALKDAVASQVNSVAHNYNLIDPNQIVH
jgi:hypothetical protein